MTKRKKVTLDAIADEMGAVAAFARSSHTAPDGASKEGNGQALLAGLLVAPTATLAHERRTIAGGKYEVAVGWDVEPPLEGQKNAASILIVRADTSPSQPVEGAEVTLRVRIRQGAETRDFPLRTVFGQRGHYVAHFVPTRAGDYEFTFVGAIEGHPVEEIFDSAAGRFGGVEPVADVQFPVCLGGPSQISAAMREAQSATQSARLLTATGLGIGTLGLLGLLTSWRVRSGRGAPPAAVMSTDPSREETQDAAPAGEGGPVLPEVGGTGEPGGLAEDFGLALQGEIAHALQPVQVDFGRQMAQLVRERTERALRPLGTRVGRAPSTSRS